MYGRCGTRIVSCMCRKSSPVLERWYFQHHVTCPDFRPAPLLALWRSPRDSSHFLPCCLNLCLISALLTLSGIPRLIIISTSPHTTSTSNLIPHCHPLANPHRFFRQPDSAPLRRSTLCLKSAGVIVIVVVLCRSLILRFHASRPLDSFVNILVQ